MPLSGSKLGTDEQQRNDIGGRMRAYPVETSLRSAPAGRVGLGTWRLAVVGAVPGWVASARHPRREQAPAVAYACAHGGGWADFVAWAWWAQTPGRAEQWHSWSIVELASGPSRPADTSFPAA
uniref:Uncharacterized protein n=1 Tax=Mycena chlorophos TaxID=658473 RepID=A0ABQ0LJE6_MYCCL|nr:predicted protein [Mycena chlorophos]